MNRYFQLISHLRIQLHHRTQLLHRHLQILLRHLHHLKVNNRQQQVDCFPFQEQVLSHQPYYYSDSFCHCFSYLILWVLNSSIINRKNCFSCKNHWGIHSYLQLHRYPLLNIHFYCGKYQYKLYNKFLCGTYTRNALFCHNGSHTILSQILHQF